MEPIRLPLRRHKIEGGGECNKEVERIDLRRFVSMFINQTLREMKEALGKFYSISETVCRRELSVFFKQKAADFECLFLFISGIECLKEVSSNRHRIRKIKGVDTEYVLIADRLAHLFESFKSMIIPKSDILTSLQTIYNPGYLLPKLTGDCAKHEVTSFEEINRITRMYLDKEDLSMYNSIAIEQGIAILSSKFFSFSLALCGEISRPEWKLINVKGGNEVFSRHLLFAMPHRIDKISRFLRIYEAHTKAREIFLMVKKSSNHIEMNIQGHYRRFEVSFHVFRMSVNVERCDINGKMFIENDVLPSGEDVVQSFEDKVSKYLCKDGRNASFTFKRGFTAFDGEESRYFKSFVELDVFLGKKEESSRFYRFFEERFPCYRNHRKGIFGDRNVFIMRDGLFVCIRLVRLGESHMEVRVFVGCYDLVDFLSYTEVSMEVKDNGEIVGIINEKEKKQPSLKIECLHEYFERNMDLLLLSYRFLSVVNGRISIEGRVLLSHRTRNEEIDISVEKKEGGVFIATSRFGERMASSEGIYNCVAFALLLMDILTYSKGFSLVNVISMDLYKGVSLRISGLLVTLRMNSEGHLESSPLGVSYILKNCSVLGIMDLLCCFHGLFSNGLIPTTSTTTSLVFVFRHLFKGSVKMKMIDRTKYTLSLSGGRIKDALGGFGPEILTSDTVFLRKLSGFYFKERINMITDVAKKSYSVTINENEVSVSTPCGDFKISIEGGRYIFRICSINMAEPSDEFTQTISKYFGEIMSIEKYISDSMRFLNSIDELIKLFDSIRTKRKSNYNGQIY
ncbi:hypothetical protein EROM_080670 [Encephalitozoon romaleae SJ-2008]|uniref:Uncharacterized protein n=1 Tax=Encephalitozoon romaleae (strain SJ-2008) TaxID=1178016 RepID=I6ZUT7_ENCRO|nr:hypothetical protein EROM_080670 [Encephalitozoon romaleae SJ-2008]AFN83486.1 hypothetical protein EROM_080670 [Encephalitozoon romaleae SJ-2008]